MLKTSKVFLVIGTLFLLQKTDPVAAVTTNPCQYETCSTGKKCCNCWDPINFPAYYPLCIDESESCTSNDACGEYFS